MSLYDLRICLAALIATLTTPTLAAAPMPVKLVRAEQDVVQTRNEESRTLLPGVGIEADTLIRTAPAGRAEFSLSGATSMSLGSDTEVLLHNADQGVLRVRLARGNMSVDTRALKGQAAHDVRVNLGELRLRLAAAQGWMEQSGEGSQICLLAGVIEVQVADRTHRLDLPGQCLRRYGITSQWSMVPRAVLDERLASAAVPVAAPATIAASVEQKPPLPPPVPVSAPRAVPAPAPVPVPTPAPTPEVVAVPAAPRPQVVEAAAPAVVVEVAAVEPSRPPIVASVIPPPPIPVAPPEPVEHVPAIANTMPPVPVENPPPSTPPPTAASAEPAISAPAKGVPSDVASAAAAEDALQTMPATPAEMAVATPAFAGTVQAAAAAKAEPREVAPPKATTDALPEMPATPAEVAVAPPAFAATLQVAAAEVAAMERSAAAKSTTPVVTVVQPAAAAPPPVLADTAAAPAMEVALAAPAVEVASPAIPDDGRRWSVVLASLGERETADKAAEQFKAMGLDAVAREYRVGARHGFRVGLGRYDSREEADAALSALLADRPALAAWLARY